MAPKAPEPEPTQQWVKILEQSEEYRFKLFRILRARLQFRRFDGEMSDPIIRISFDRGDSVGVLLYDARHDAVVLVRQFRYPVYTRLDTAQRAGDGAQQAWLLEAVAGVQDKGRTITEVGNAELLEEAGYRISGDLRPITSFYPSPGGTSERIHLFWAEVDAQKRTAKGGGIAAEGEDTQIVVLPLGEAMDMIATGEICDAKSIIALQYLALHKRAQREGRE